MDFLFGSTPAQKEVDKATSDMLLSPDWGANMEIIDQINRDKNGGREYAKALSKRLKHDNDSVTRLALELTGACVKNCTGGSFHAHVHEQEFLNTVVKVAQRKGDVRDMALTLLMEWAEAFKDRKDLPNFYSTYTKLRTKGVDFPARDMNRMAPVFTPQAKPQPQKRQAAERPQPSSQASQPSSAGLERKQAPAQTVSFSGSYEDKMKREMKQTLEYVSLANTLIDTAERSKEALQADRSARDLHRTLLEIQNRLMRCVVEIEDESLVMLCIAVNEHVSNSINYHKSIMEGKPYKLLKLQIPKELEESAAQPSPSPKPSPDDVLSAPAPAGRPQVLNIIELDDEPEPEPSPGVAPEPSPSPQPLPAGHDDDEADPFDGFHDDDVEIVGAGAGAAADHDAVGEDEDDPFAQLAVRNDPKSVQPQSKQQDSNPHSPGASPSAVEDELDDLMQLVGPGDASENVEVSNAELDDLLNLVSDRPES